MCEVEDTLLKSLLLATFLITLYVILIPVPYFNHVTKASGLNTLLTVPGQTVKLVYEYDYSLSVMGGKNSPVKMLVVQHYIINIENYNRTHVEVSGEPVGNVSVLFSSNSWIAISVLMRAISQNVTKLIEGLSLRTIRTSLISKKDFSYEIAKVMYVSPIVTLSNTTNCVNFTLNGVKFKTAKYSSGLNGVSYYECRTGVLLRYDSRITKEFNIGNASLHVVRELKVTLVGGDKETLSLLGGSELTETPTQRRWLGISPVTLAILAGSAVAFAVSLFFFLRSYKLTHHQR